MFQSNNLLACKVLRKLFELFGVIDALVVVPVDAMNRLKENLKVEDGTVS